jgi:hypothetical protein
MKKLVICSLSACVMLAVSALDLRAGTTFTGDPGDSPYTLQQFGDPPGPLVAPTGGNPGGVLVLSEAVNSQHNWATFDVAESGPAATFRFDFRIEAPNTPSADGISFTLANTSVVGASGPLGAPPFTAEDPALASSLGIGFDTWSNQGAFDDPNVPTGSDYQEISVFWNGALVNRIDDTRLLPTPLTLDDAQWHSVAGNVDFAGGTLDLVVDGQTIHSGLSIPGLTAYESRVMFAARTGGENEQALVDNVNVQYVPEPATGLMALIFAGTWLGFARRRRHR